jgi:hypothetical protein
VLLLLLLLMLHATSFGLCLNTAGAYLQVQHPHLSALAACCSCTSCCCTFEQLSHLLTLSFLAVSPASNNGTHSVLHKAPGTTFRLHADQWL